MDTTLALPVPRRLCIVTAGAELATATMLVDIIAIVILLQWSKMELSR